MDFFKGFACQSIIELSGALIHLIRKSFECISKVSILSWLLLLLSVCVWWNQKKMVGKEKIKKKKINRWLDTRLISKYKYETRGAQKKINNLKLINNVGLITKK